MTPPLSLDSTTSNVLPRLGTSEDPCSYDLNIIKIRCKCNKIMSGGPSPPRKYYLIILNSTFICESSYIVILSDEVHVRGLRVPSYVLVRQDIH